MIFRGIYGSPSFGFGTRSHKVETMLDGVSVSLRSVPFSLGWAGKKTIEGKNIGNLGEKTMIHIEHVLWESNKKQVGKTTESHRH